MSVDIPFSGRIRETRFPLLLRMLQQRQLSGTLNLLRNDLDKSLYLKDGDIIFATSRYPDDRLGVVLLKAGKITFPQYETSSQLLEKTGKRQGTILVEQGYLTPSELFSGVLLQVKEIILSLFTWIDGDYHFIQGELPSEEVITLKISTTDLVHEGIFRISGWIRLVKDLHPFESRRRLTNDPRALFQSVRISAPEAALISGLNGESIHSVLSSSSLSPFNTLRLLYFSLSVGIVEIADEGADDKGRDAEPATARIAAEAIKESIFQQESESAVDLEHIRQAHRKIQSQNFYEILGVNRESGRAEIKRAYFRLAKVYHPDRHFEEGMHEVKKELEDLFSRITEAYDTLTSPEQRAAYDGKAAKSAPDPPLSPERKAQMSFQQGQEALQAKDFKKAAYLFEASTRLESKNHMYFGCLGKSLLQLPGEVHRAEQALREAVTLKPEAAEYHVLLAEIYETGGLLRRALKEYEEALVHNPEDLELKEHFSRLKKKV